MRTNEDAATFLSATSYIGMPGEYLRAVQAVRLEAFIAGEKHAAEIVRKRQVAVRYAGDRNWNTMMEDTAQNILTDACGRKSLPEE